MDSAVAEPLRNPTSWDSKRMRRKMLACAALLSGAIKTVAPSVFETEEASKSEVGAGPPCQWSKKAGIERNVNICTLYTNIVF